MKKLFILIALISHTTFAGICPNLAGEFHCYLSDGRYSKLKIEQRLVSEPGSNEMVEYGFTYFTISPDPDFFNASERGELDSFGWLNRCAGKKLISTSQESNLIVELSINDQGGFTYAENSRPVFICSK
jgi:hypothetical protein